MLGPLSVVSLLTMAVPSSAALIFSDPLQGSTSGTTQHVTISPTHVMLDQDDSWVQYTGPQIPAERGTISLWLRIAQGCEGGELISDGYLKPATTELWPTFSVSVTPNSGTGNYALHLNHWNSKAPSKWYHLHGPAVLAPDVWYHVGLTWGMWSATKKGMAIWVDGVRRADDPTITSPHEDPVGYSFTCWGLGQLYNAGTLVPTCHSVSVRDLCVYDMIEDYGGTNAGPVLLWAGTPGFLHDGVKPDCALHRSTITFKVKYTDREGNPPVGGVRLHLLRDGIPITGSPFNMKKGTDSDYTAGVIYSHTRTLPWGDYSYNIQSTDACNAATGDPTTTQQGPEIITPPVLTRARVIPTAGDASTKFRYRVDYSATDGKPARWVELEIKTYTPEVGWKRHAYRRYGVASGGSALFTLRLAGLFPDATRFQYRFQALKGQRRCRLTTQTTWAGGPKLTGAAARGLTLSSACAAPTRTGGAQVVCSLSAPAEVSARILNVAGRPVRSLFPIAGSAGLNTLLWDGKSDAGLGVPAGQYVIEVTAHAADGQQARVLASVQLRR
jgi:hypothetical protein